ncbi:Hypothetical predicted protein [Mytilus galloprovincialis]|uniref:Uncharacterized protein n=1 Tax=Mytilus galloprovincialis TaxID=29158 RepID=A0A8B6EAI6_MYTGA|nr:Hypothetical predicted protein [Mytilus galloprovincialis]
MVQTAHMTVGKMLQTDSGRKQLKKLFKLCDDIDIANTKDVANFYSNLAGNFEGVVQYNKDNRAFEDASGCIRPVQFGFYQTSDLKDQPFTGFSFEQCVDIFGAKFNADLIQKGINRTNTNYGAYAMNPTKIVFPNGSIDPWHAFSFTTTSADQHFTTIYIDGTAHCANMYPSTPADPPQLTESRKTINILIGQWLTS